MTKELIKMTINTEKELENVSGGSPFANGSYVDYGNYIVYTVASGDTLIGIGSRFGVNFMQVAQWNNMADPNMLRVGQQLTIYPTILGSEHLQKAEPRRVIGGVFSRNNPPHTIKSVVHTDSIEHERCSLLPLRFILHEKINACHTTELVRALKTF